MKHLQNIIHFNQENTIETIVHTVNIKQSAIIPGIENTTSIAQKLQEKDLIKAILFIGFRRTGTTSCFVCTVLILQKKLVKYCDCLVFSFFPWRFKSFSLIRK
jgi:hypothetical protein